MGLLSRLGLLSLVPLPIGRGVAEASRFNYAVELDRQGKTAEAEQIYIALFEADQQQIGAAINLADIWIRSDRAMDAATLLRAVAANYPNYCDVWANLSAALSKIGDHEAALEAATNAVATGPGPKQYYNRAECWWALKQYQLAIRDYETALECDPSDDEIATKLRLARLALQERPHQPFGDAQYEPMGRAHGTWIVDGIEVASTLQCPHAGCGGSHFVSLRGSGRRRYWCSYCDAVTCGAPACDICIPFQKVLDESAKLAQM